MLAITLIRYHNGVKNEEKKEVLNNMDLFENKQRGRPFKANAKPTKLRQHEYKQKNGRITSYVSKQALQDFEEIAEQFKTKREALEAIIAHYKITKP